VHDEAHDVPPHRYGEQAWVPFVQVPVPLHVPTVYAVPPLQVFAPQTVVEDG
jgi:hypothetical protein